MNSGDNEDLNYKMSEKSNDSNNQNTKNILFVDSQQFKNNNNSGDRYYPNEEEEKLSPLLNEINYIELFNEIISSINKIIFQKGKDENDKEDNIHFHQKRKSSFIYDSINEEEIDYNQLSSEVYNIIYKLHSENKNILLIKNKFENNVAQYYISSGLILVSLEIIKIYYKILINEMGGQEKFFKWLINDNNEGENILEIGIGIQVNPKDQIYFYKQIFEFFEKSDNNNVVYQLLENRKNNILTLCVKEEKLFLLLFLYEKIKKYFPSTNPLNIKNKFGLSPLHYSCSYSLREITENLLILDCQINITDKNENIPLHFAVKGGDLSIVKKLLLYGADRNKLNNQKLSPIDYAYKYGNYAMKNLFTKNPLYKIEKLKGVKHDKLLILFFFGCFLLKYFIYNYFWKSYICDIICFFFFLYFIFKKRDYYKNKDFNLPSKNITIEKLLEDCDYEKIKVFRICPKCKLIKSYYMKHCMVCDQCVDNFDHHCFWINKCINNNNYFEFILFLVIMLIDLLINFFLFLIELKNIMKNKNQKNIVFYLKLCFLSLYLIIFIFGITLISRMLLERIRGKLSSKKKLTLEENLLNKKNTEEELEEENNINLNDKNEKNNIKLKVKENNKDEEIEFKI